MIAARGGKTLVYGLHAVEALLQRDAQAVAEIWVQINRQDARVEHIVQQAREAGVPLRRLARGELERHTGDVPHQGVVAWSTLRTARGEQALRDTLDQARDTALFLVLDGVQDPHNLGACLRTADAAGVHAVVAPRDRAAGLTPVARKVASGAAETVPFVQVTNLARTLRWLRQEGVWIVGADSAAPTELYQADLRGPLALVLGAEGSGLRRLTRELCDVLTRIPMAGTVASLNVSVAAGVLLFEALRQRGSRPELPQRRD